MSKALIVVDMQNDFIDGVLGTQEAQNIVDNVVKKIENFNGSIYVTKDTHYDDYMKTQEGLNLPVEHCIRGTKGWALNNKVFNVLNNTTYELYEKPTFGSISLASYLSEDPFLDEIEIIGLCTDICIISNALLLKAFIPDVKITVDASCCAGVTPESHNNALKAMKMCQINIVNE
jgi:nicotinamidase-related amidase